MNCPCCRFYFGSFLTVCWFLRPDLSIEPWLSWNSLCRADLPQIQRAPPTFVCPPSMSAEIKACHLSEPLFTSGRTRQVYIFSLLTILFLFCFWAASEIFWSVHRPDFASSFILHLLSLLFRVTAVLETHVGWQTTRIYFCSLCPPALPQSPLSLKLSSWLLSCHKQLGSSCPPFCHNRTQWCRLLLHLPLSFG